MKVLLVSQQYPPETACGGIGTQTQNKARALAADGHFVSVLSCASTATETREVTPDGITVHRVKPPGSHAGREFPIHGEPAYWIGYSFGLLPMLNELIETVQPDVIEFPEYGAEGFVYQLDRTRANWAAVVVHLHAPLELLAQRLGWPEPGSLFLETGSYLERASIRLADGLAASSGAIADFVVGWCGVARDAIDVLPTGVDLESFRPGSLDGSENGHPTVLFVGKVACSKGVETAFEAVLRLRNKYPRIRLRVAGAENQCSAQLRERARRAGAPESLELLGFVGHDELPELYRQARVFCSPAQFEGGVACVYGEAMACGCPVVASTAGGGAEAVVDGQSGFLVPPLDVDAVVDRLDRLLADRNLAGRIGACARRQAEERFSLSALATAVARTYERAIVRSQERLSRQ